MRSKLPYLFFFLSILLAMPACKKLKDLYYDSDQIVEPSVAQLLTAMIDNDRVRPSYWEIRTFVAMHTGIYSQSLAFLNNSNIYQQNPSYTQDRWNDFYRPGVNGGGVMAHYREIEKAYNALPASVQADNRLFLEAARLLLYDQAAQMVDLWGDIPFSEAGSLNAKGEVIMPHFDDGAKVYDAILYDLAAANEYWKAPQVSAAARAVFDKQDILFQGNTEKWRSYANGLRLRLLMRISMVNEARAQPEVLQMLQNPDEYPLPGEQQPYDPGQSDLLLRPLTSYTLNLRFALTELYNYSAPEYLLEKVMKPASDPRIPVMFDKYGRTVNEVFIPNATYKGLPMDKPAVEQQIMIGDCAILDSATFLLNAGLPGIIMTGPEMDFLRAEAYQRWGGGDAAAAYDSAVKKSIVFYYYLNSLNKITRDPLPLPSGGEIQAFMQNDSIRYEGSSEHKLQLIWTQKWVHFGFLQSVQSWSELRRTGYPQLSFPASSLPGYELPPNRLTYPASEANYNPNYALVKERDRRDGKIFWQIR